MNMKKKLGKYLAELRTGFGRVVRRFPVETALAAVAAALVVWWGEAERFTLFPPANLWLFPLFAAGAFAINMRTQGTPWHRLYFICWLPLLPLLFRTTTAEWIRSEQFAVTLGILAPLVMLLCRRERDNRRFAADALLYLRAAVTALFFANIALALFEATLWSAAYIFGFDEVRRIARLGVEAVTVANVLGAPILFLMLFDRWENREHRLDRGSDALLGWIVTPALVVYALLLHLYAARILVLWSLPRGGVAYLVFGFTLLAFGVRMVRELSGRRIAEWFYARFSGVMLVPMALFWIGVAQRLGEYGLTAQRVYLVVSGLVMTLAVLFFFLRAGRYLWLFAAAFVLFAAVAFVPALSPERLGLRSQRARFERLGHDLDLLDGEGRFVERRVAASDSVRRSDYGEFFAAMRYVEQRDTTFFASLGLADSSSSWALEYGMLPWTDAVVEVAWSDDELVEVELPYDVRVVPDAAYPHLRVHVRHPWQGVREEGLRLVGDSVVLRLDGRLLLAVTGEELVRSQLQRAGVTFEELSDLDEAQRIRLLDYRGDEVRILFRSLKIGRADSLRYDCRGAVAELVMTR